MNIEVGDRRQEEHGRQETGDGRQETGEQEKDIVNATVGWVSPFRGLRGERGKEDGGKINKE